MRKMPKKTERFDLKPNAVKSKSANVKKNVKFAEKAKFIAKRIIGGIKHSKRNLRRDASPEIAATGDMTVEAQKCKIEEAKYYPRPTPYMPTREWEREDLPSRYGDNKVVLMVRDPYWLHSYWDVAEARKREVEQEAAAEWKSLKKILRVYDVTGINFDGANANKFFDIDITPEASNWYIHVGESDKAWCADFGVMTPSGKFLLIARSNIVATPRDKPSDVIDEEWMSLEEEFMKLYGFFGGFGLSSPQMGQLRKKMKERLQRELASGGVSSFARPAKQRGFWLVVNTELIVYGATEPDATVTVQDRPIKLNRDGTFSLRFALPDGEQVIPVKGVSADKEEERVITPIVRKHTK
ncbi:MAG: DUF4912 domain-containing protein [Candidatus Omnitrophota bacterium]